MAKKDMRALQNDVIDDVIRGKNDKFVHDYDFKELSMVVHVEVKLPNFRERAQILAQESDLLSGTVPFQTVGTDLTYQTLIILDVCGKGTKVTKTVVDDDGEEKDVEVPDYFSLNGYPRQDVILKIGEDIQEWMDSFRG